MTLNNKQVTGIILSGGQSSRMGKDKGKCLLNNRSLVEYAIDVLMKVCGSILIGANDPDYQSYGCPVIEDQIKGIGPIGGIYSCLNSSPTPDNIVLSVDMPMVSSELLRHLLQHKAHHDAVVPMFNAHPEPLCAYYSKAAIPVIEKRIKDGNYKMQGALRELNTRYLDITPDLNFYHHHLFANINQPADLAQLEAELKKRMI